MKHFAWTWVLLPWASLAGGCAISPASVDEAGLHPADPQAPAAPLPPLTWRSVVLAAAATAETTSEAMRHADHADHQVTPDTVTGTVTAVDREAQRLTLAHGPIPGLGMPAMEMAFDVAEPGLLEALSTGDEVRFTVRRGEREGQFVVTAIEPAPDDAEDHDNHGDHRQGGDR